MKGYFQLTFRRLVRLQKEAGVNPYLGMGVAVVIFAAASFAILTKAPFPAWSYALVALFSTNFLGSKERNQFLQQCFTHRSYRRLRWVENLLWTAPFALVLVAKAEFLVAAVLLVGASATSRLAMNLPRSFALPTPFSKRPFEFAVGFRKTFWVYPLAWGLLYFAYDSGNYNLGVFALAITLLAPIGHYGFPEPKLYVWTYNLNPARFIRSKLATGLLFTASLSLPITTALSIAFPAYAWLNCAFQALGLLYVALGILGKYAYYPSAVNIMPMLALGGCLLFPPALLVVLPSFYALSLRKLQPLLA